MMMEKVNCAICGVDDAVTLFIKGDLNVDMTNVVCRRCALVYLNPRMTAEESLKFHVTDFLRERHGLTEAISLEPKVKGSDLRMKSKVADFIATSLKKGVRVLDVGCGFGTLLNIFRERYGAEVVGIELADVDVLAAKKFYGIDLFHGSLEEYAEKFPEARFDCIVLHHTFEHLPAPRKILQILKKLFAPSGILYIGVPNVVNLKKRPEIFFQMGHAYSYSPSTLQKILRQESFEIIKFNRQAAFPGAMEILAMRREDLGNNFLVGELKEGADYRQVLRCINWNKNKFALLRMVRNVVLFWLPQRARLKISQAILQVLKKL